MNSYDKEVEIKNNYIQQMIQYFNEVINSKKLGFEFVEMYEMIGYLCALEFLMIHKDDESGHNIEFNVPCSDVFVWGCSDAEDITYDEIPDLFWYCLNDPDFGSVKWCCKKNNIKPQTPMVKRMKQKGAWEDWMDDLDESIM